MKRTFKLAALGLAAAGCHGNSPNRQLRRELDDSDQRYLQHVADRDQDMIALAAVAQSKASDAHIRTMAHNATVKQQAELHQVEGWLKAWYGASYTPRATADGRQMLAHL